MEKVEKLEVKSVMLAMAFIGCAAMMNVPDITETVEEAYELV